MRATAHDDKGLQGSPQGADIARGYGLVRLIHQRGGGVAYKSFVPKYDLYRF